MNDDMGFDLKLPDVGELTFPQWRNWLAQYNKFIGERDVRYAAGLRERDDRIEKLEAALHRITDLTERWENDLVSQAKEIARKALEVPK
jgi:hypothetical protein